MSLPNLQLSAQRLHGVPSRLQSMHFTAYNYLMAASMISMIPTLMLFVAAQRRLTRGVAFSGPKN